jgi:hypothetical protein
MSDLGNLQKRVGSAVDRLIESQEARQRNNLSLGRILNDLEIKFEARKIELDHCHARIAQLEESNRSLTDLVGRMVEIVEKTADEFSEDPVFRTTAVAGEIIDRFVPKIVADNSPVAEETPKEIPAMGEHEAFSGAHGTFQNVGEDLLIAELIDEKTTGSNDYPQLVFDAAALAREGDAPAPAEPKAQEPEDLGIKEIMARLEIAAERAQLGSAATGEDDETVEKDRAVGGRA